MLDVIFLVFYGELLVEWLPLLIVLNLYIYYILFNEFDPECKFNYPGCST
jgi:hypothetical protein